MKYLFPLLLLTSVTFAAEETIQLKITSPEDMYCTTNTYGEYIASGSRCFYGDVMTGIQSVSPIQIRCSRLTVNCSRKDKE